MDNQYSLEKARGIFYGLEPANQGTLDSCWNSSQFLSKANTYSCPILTSKQTGG